MTLRPVSRAYTREALLDRITRRMVPGWRLRRYLLTLTARSKSRQDNHA